ncbi:DNA adenine methylase [uncultured Duncaniella sp.]|uniref:DNA adenine methylase n=1 Tax=uncultured Duncaniella sp. TaxID=2768039 RepID=UPI00260BA5D2|nr:DNA adenine methylase [uncultured Duncaniella sp.]
MKGSIPHIVQYQGSKRKLAPQILSYFPQRFNRLIEPFAGMAAVSIATAKEHRCPRFFINDLNEPLLGILREAVNNPDKIVSDYTAIWEEQFRYEAGSEAHYYHIRERFNNGEKDPSMMLYILARCVKGAVRYGSNGRFNQSPDKRRNGTNPQTLRRNIAGVSQLLRGKSEFYAMDYREVLDMAAPGDVVYLDPPYQGVCTGRDSRYYSGIAFNEFVEALDKLNSRNVDYIVSYDGFCGDKGYGEILPDDLGLKLSYLNAGLSTQSLFNGERVETKEALYVSRNLAKSGMVLQPSLPLF